MSFHDTFYQTKTLLVQRLQELGITNATMNMGWTTLLNLHAPSYLTITVPSGAITVGQALTITGKLTSDGTNGISGETINLKVNGNLVTGVAATTTSNGSYSLTYTPSSSGTYTFQTTYNGNNIHQNTNSATETRYTLKNTTITLTHPAWMLYSTSETYNITATLKDENNNLLTGETITLEQTGGKVDTSSGTTNSNGAYSKTGNTLTSYNQVDITATFNGRADYNQSTASGTIDVGVGLGGYDNITVNGHVVI